MIESIRNLSSEERVYFYYILNQRNEVFEEVYPDQAEFVADLADNSTNPLLQIDPKKEFGEYAIGKLYSNPDVIDVMMEELGDLFGGSGEASTCLLYTSPSPRDRQKSRMPSSA